MKAKPFLKKILRGTAFFFAALLVFCSPVQAATVKKTDYKGSVVASSVKELALKPGETVTLNVAVKNTGKAAWNKAGTRFVSIYTYFPKYRASVFADKSWYKKDQPALLTEKTVKPGATGHFSFKLTAPKTPGTYEEGFNVSAEDFTWIAGTQFKVKITVKASEVSKAEPKPNATTASAPAPKPAPVPAAVTPPAPQKWAADLMIKSYQATGVALAGGKTAAVTVGFKNIGTEVWQTRILRMRGTSIAAAVSLADANWPNAQEPSRVREPISPGNLGYFTFNIQAPPAKGTYNLPLKLVIDGNDVPGTEFDIPVTVTEDAPELPQQEIPITPGSAAEPLIRVGLWAMPGDAVILNSSAFSIVGPGGVTIATVPAGLAVTARYDRQSAMVTVNTPNGQFGSAVPVRFVPSDPTGLFQVPNFGGWAATAYTNQFRGTFEIDYYKPNDNVWLIEELPLEQYLRGLAETSNDSNHEFQKALVVAARNYAYFVHSIGGKYALFDVQTGAADQVYRAYGSETIRPNLVRAVEETKGQVVTYGNDIVVTPYFSRSDGRTRAWGEVWHGSKPWLVSVSAPHDAGKTLWGHGVGMSASDALGWANDGRTYDWILGYFYTGTTLKKIY